MHFKSSLRSTDIPSGNRNSAEKNYQSFQEKQPAQKIKPASKWPKDKLASGEEMRAHLFSPSSLIFTEIKDNRIRTKRPRGHIKAQTTGPVGPAAQQPPQKRSGSTFPANIENLLGESGQMEFFYNLRANLSSLLHLSLLETHFIHLPSMLMQVFQPVIINVTHFHHLSFLVPSVSSLKTCFLRKCHHFA